MKTWCFRTPHGYFRKFLVRLFKECFKRVLFCNFVVWWQSSQLPKQKEDLLLLFLLVGGGGWGLDEPQPF